MLTEGQEDGMVWNSGRGAAQTVGSVQAKRQEGGSITW